MYFGNFLKGKGSEPNDKQQSAAPAVPSEEKIPEPPVPPVQPAEAEPAPAVVPPLEEKEVPAVDKVCSTPVLMCLKDTGDVAKAALYLAMSDGITEERRIKDALASCGWRGVATEVGGISGEMSQKVSRALVGAALNSGVVRKTTSEMHALLHAAQESFNSFIPFGMLETSVGVKIAIVRNSQWLAVAVAGDTAFHAVAHHVRMGVGVMHL